MEPEHATVDLVTEGDATGHQTRATVTCSCGEAITTEWHGSAFTARRAAEDEFRRHRQFRMMHVGLFEDLP